jgi:Uncharacterised nucleotidyltransferase
MTAAPVVKEELSTVRMPAEQRVLVAIARLQLDAAQEESLGRLLSSPINWDALLDEARWHKLEGMLFHHLRKPAFSSRVPPQVMATLKGLYSRNVARHLFFTQELGEVLTVLEERRISSVILKGAGLVHTIYHDPGLRPMSDLDILVPFGRSQEAYEAVRHIGYQPVVGATEQAQMQDRDRQLAALARPGRPVVVELHTHLVERDSPMRLDVSQFWNGTREVQIAGHTAQVLTPEYEIAFLCNNFFKDRRYYSYSALGQLCDIAEVCRAQSTTTDWSKFGLLGPLGPMTGPIFCGLYLARHLLGAPVPDEALAATEPPGFRPVQARLLVEQRVLSRNFTTRELVKPSTEKYGLVRALREGVRRICPDRPYLTKRYNLRPGFRWIYLLYLRRAAESLGVAVKLALRPGRARDEFSVDRWMHSLNRLRPVGGPAAPPVDQDLTPPRPVGETVGGQT